MGPLTPTWWPNGTVMGPSEVSLRSILKAPTGHDDPAAREQLQETLERGWLLVWSCPLPIKQASATKWLKITRTRRGSESDRHRLLKHSVAELLMEWGGADVAYESPVAYGSADVYSTILDLPVEVGFCPPGRAMSVLSGDRVLGVAPYSKAPILYILRGTPEGRAYAAEKHQKWQDDLEARLLAMYASEAAS